MTSQTPIKQISLGAFWWNKAWACYKSILFRSLYKLYLPVDDYDSEPLRHVEPVAVHTGCLPATSPLHHVPHYLTRQRLITWSLLHTQLLPGNSSIYCPRHLPLFLLIRFSPTASWSLNKAAHVWAKVFLSAGMIQIKMFTANNGNRTILTKSATALESQKVVTLTLLLGPLTPKRYNIIIVILTEDGGSCL